MGGVATGGALAKAGAAAAPKLAAQLPGWLKAAGFGGGLGGLFGAGYSEGDLEERAEAAAYGASLGAVTGTVYAPGDFVLQDIERAPTGELFLADRSVTNPGIRLYDVETGAEITSTPIDVGLPPFQITFGVVR